MYRIAFAILAALSFALPRAVHATSGPGCFQVVHVAKWDVLNIRRHPSPRSQIVGTIPPSGHGIIALEGQCMPSRVPLLVHWCPIGYYDGNLTVHGFVKRYYLRPSDCP